MIGEMDQGGHSWWQDGIFYQIYPRSFQDSNADGVGDIAGIAGRLPYLEALGIDAIWLSPVFPSPMADFGYDISDYTGIDPLFGTIEDFDALVSAAHAAGLKIILDLVPNHTSDRHPWFIESRASRDNPKRDWYLWRDPKADGSAPNNWLSEFRDNPPNPHYREGRPPNEKFLTQYSTDQPEVQQVVAEMRRVIDEFDDRVLIGEIYLPIERLVAYYGNDLRGAQMPFNFALLSTLWSARSIEKIIGDYESALPPGAWPNWVLGNHDRPRVASRVGAEQARVAAMLLLTLRGTPTLYYGDEIGMHQVAIAPDQVRDPFEKNVPGIGVGRDGCRTPMQWDATRYAGFSTVQPWLPLADDFQRENVVNLDADEGSILRLYRALIALRKQLPHLSSGDYVPIAAQGTLLLYRRQSEGRAAVIALNLADQPVSIEAKTIGNGGEILLSTFLDRQGEKIEGALDLRGNEGVIIGPSGDQAG